MRIPTSTVAAIVGGLGATVAAGLAAGASRWNRASRRTVVRLNAQREAPGTPTRAVTFDPAALAELPEPVRRYLAFALTPGQPIVRRARIQHAGDFAAAPGGWRPFRSVQHVTTAPPGFVWDARLAMSPVLRVRVRDAYIGAEGSMYGAVGGLVPVADQRGTPKIAASALWRLLAESVWWPTALLPGSGVAWAAIDDRTARATLTDRAVSASADFHFGSNGEVVRVTGERYRAVGDGQRLTPTEGHHRDYVRIGGMMVPQSGDVAWLLPEGRHAYWRARLRQIEYEYADGSRSMSDLRPN